jgi:tetratricopeptide (TPR) repeat protein
MKSISTLELVTRIRESLRETHPEPAYTLALGSGFSIPVVPSTTNLARQIPEWLALRRGLTAGERAEFVSGFWTNISAEAGGTLSIETDGSGSSVPVNWVEGYREAMSGSNQSGLNTPGLRREFLRQIISDHPQENAAHLFLAGIIGRQDDKPFARPFARTIFTTNFDSLLQRALQRVQALYYMTDDPDAAFEPDESSRAIHLVYLHGSIHRYRILNTSSEIDAALSRSGQLVSFLSRHGVIVIGYGGWDDVLMAALAKVKTCDGNLYWCGLDRDAATANLSAQARALLERLGDSAFYVSIPDAGSLMRSLHEGLGLGGLPDVVGNPLAGVISSLRRLDLSAVEGEGSSRASLGSVSKGTPTGVVTPEDGLGEEQGAGVTLPEPEQTATEGPLVQLRDLTIRQLEAAERYFLGLRGEVASTRKSPADASEVAALMNEALIAWYRDNYRVALEIWDRVLRSDSATVADRVRARANSGISHERLGNESAALAAYDLVASDQGAPIELLAVALTNRGIIRGRRSDHSGAESDFTRVLELPMTDGTAKAMAYNNRGLARVELGHFQEAVGDFNAVLESGASPSEQRALAYFNLGTSLHRIGKIAPAIDALSCGLQEPGLPDYLRARLLYNRAVISTERNLRAAVADYDEMLSLDGLSGNDRARALHNRAVVRGRLGDNEGAIADYTSVFNITDAPIAARMEALLARAQREQKSGREDDALRDYDQAINASDAPAHLRERARLNRSIAWGRRGKLADARSEVDDLASNATDHDVKLRARFLRGQRRVNEGDKIGAEEDFSAVAESDGDPGVRALALGERGWLRFESDPAAPAKAIDDYRVALELDPSLGLTRANLALAYLVMGDLPTAEKEYRRAIADIQDPSNVGAVVGDLDKFGPQSALADLVRGLASARTQELAQNPN